MDTQKWRLIFDGPDKPGIVAAITQCISNHQGLIIEANHHSDLNSKWFFMRQDMQFPTSFNHKQLQKDLQLIKKRISGHIQLINPNINKKVVIMVSRHMHCLHELLYRFTHDNLPGKLVGVISNHPDAAVYCKHHQVQFIHNPIDAQDRETGFLTLASHLNTLQPDVIVLARYMQILPSQLCQQYRNQIINIHHSFLPSFSGGDAYQQAFDRGVKLIGATCHYVTQDLDEGPIIGQDITRITHDHQVEELKRIGRNIEKLVLADGLNKHLNDRIFIHNNKTIVF